MLPNSAAQAGLCSPVGVRVLVCEGPRTGEGRGDVEASRSGGEKGEAGGLMLRGEGVERDWEEGTVDGRWFTTSTTSVCIKSFISVFGRSSAGSDKIAAPVNTKAGLPRRLRADNGRRSLEARSMAAAKGLLSIRFFLLSLLLLVLLVVLLLLLLSWSS